MAESDSMAASDAVACKVCATCDRLLPLTHFYLSRPGSHKPSCKDCSKARSQAWRESNADRRAAYDRQYKAQNRAAKNAKDRQRLASDPAYALRNSIRAAIFKALASRGAKKSERVEQILGCTMQEFVAHIEKQFARGMTWENRGDWHIDHIIPLATAVSAEDVVRLTHHTNLRPLWGRENLSKGGKVQTLL